MSRAPAPKKRTSARPKATGGPRKPSLLDAIDRLTREIDLARGLVVALNGLECMAEQDRLGTEAIAEAHVDRLQQISEALVRLLPKRG